MPDFDIERTPPIQRGHPFIVAIQQSCPISRQARRYDGVCHISPLTLQRLLECPADAPDLRSEELELGHEEPSLA